MAEGISCVSAVLTGDIMDRELKQCEQLSALMDGELDGGSLAQALSFAKDEGQSTWELYHLVGDVLRSPELAAHAQSPLLTRLREQIAQEPTAPRVLAAQPMEAAQFSAVKVERPAANASVFRWKMAAGFASLAAVAAIGWNSMTALQGDGKQLAAAPVQPPAEILAVSEGAGQPVMLRDPRLDELLQAHKQFGSTSALQMPAGFLRNATFEEPSR